MHLSATLTKEDLTSAIEQVTPLRVEIRPRRVITFARPTKVVLVPGEGLRVRGHASFTWELRGLVIPVTVRVWQVLLVPSFAVRSGRHVLAFDPHLEELELRRVPAFLDGPITEAVRQGLAAQKNELVWNFAKRLSVVLPLPQRVTPGGKASLGPTGGDVVVTADDVQLTLRFALHVKREALPESVHRNEVVVGSVVTTR